MPIHGYPGNVITANPTTPTSSVASGVWTTEQQLIAMVAGNWPMAQAQIRQSLRFNSADSAYLNRTPASNGNRQIWTLSFWIKRSGLGTSTFFFSAGGTAPRASLGFQTDSKIIIRQVDSTDTESIRLVTTAVYRDVSAWYHIVVAQDTTQATASNRVKLYVNGVQVTALDTATYPAQNKSDLAVNAALEHNFGRYVNSPGDGVFNAYMTECYFIDGQQLTPSSFGQTNASTGVWGQIPYAGTYGTNGFYVNFSDNSNTTAATLGKDYSGNGNNWTPNNFSVTAGAGNDSLVDSPTSYGTDTGVGGTVRGNYCTFNPLANPVHNTVSDGNLLVSRTSGGAAGGGSTLSTMGFSSGKWYWEFYVNANGGSLGSIGVGIVPINFAVTDWVGSSAASVGYWGNGAFYGNGTGGGTPPSYTVGDTIGIALDMDALTVAFYKNGVQAGGTITGLTGTMIPAICIFDNVTASFIANFGQRAFSYTAPSGFKALCTQNLPTPTIGATSTTLAGKYFNPALYTGNGNATAQAITGVGFQPDFVWLKARSQAYENILSDAVRGAGKILYSSLGNAEATVANFVSFDSDGFTVNANGGASSFNANGVTYASWNWNAGNSTVTNTTGSISAQVRANATSGFSVIGYTGNKTSGATIGHGLGVAPAMVIIKERANSSDWIIYHQSLGATQAIYFTTAAANTNSIWFNNTAPSSTVITLGNSDGTNRANTMIAYAFAPVAGYSAFGSYTGNGSADGAFIYTGFRPRYVMVKASSTGGAGYDWFIHDTARDTYNVCTLDLEANLALSENQYGAEQDILSNGFKLRNTGGGTNGSGTTYIYAAFAESPFKYALAR